MHKQMNDLQLFHKKHNFTMGVPIEKFKDAEDVDDLAKISLTSTYDVLSKLAKALEIHLNKLVDTGAVIDPRIRRAELMVEELSEVIDGLIKCDELLLIDGLCDLLYVTFGTGVAFDLPLPEGFDEVQKSNMTKKVRGKDDVRLRNKGTSYVPATDGLRRILSEHAKHRSA